jgi:hypothetical protein
LATRPLGSIYTKFGRTGRNGRKNSAIASGRLPSSRALDAALLSRADLSDADITDEQLVEAQTLIDAIMPNSQKYEDWLKSRGEDGENSGPS